MRVAVTHCFRFSASHRLHLSSLTPAENQHLYGKCNNLHGHGHDYVLEVTCGGSVNSQTGLIVDSFKLDRLVEDNVLRYFASRNINQEVPEFLTLVPTTENIVAVMVQRLQSVWAEALGESVQLLRVHVQETDRNGFEVLVGSQRPLAQPKMEDSHG